MAQIETTGGGVSFTPDGKKVTKQIYVLTQGTTSVTPDAVAGAVITSADFSDIGAGSRRVTVTWTEGLSRGGGGGGGGGGAGSAGGGSTVELAGGAREVPIQAHKVFKDSVSNAQLQEITRAISANETVDPDIVPTATDNRARILYNMLFRGQEFYLTPAITYRETTLDASLPRLDDLCTVNAPNKAPSVASGQNWLLASVNGRSVANPNGDINYEITREWLLSDRKGWDPDGIIYDGS
jgi:hypothetical protein